MGVQKRNILIAAGVLIGLVLIGGGLWWHNHQQDQEQLASSQQADSSDDSSSGLNVSLGSASNLGQLDSTKSGQGGGAGGSGGNNSGGSLDPAQFAQYDKYKDEQNALFGEIQPGTGSALAVGQKANIYYRVWLTNGAPIDQSPVSASGQRQPFSFTLGGHQVIPGLEQGVDGMKTGGKRLVIVPPAVGYGAQGQGSIPPNAVLIFEVQLLNAR